MLLWRKKNCHSTPKFCRTKFGKMLHLARGASMFWLVLLLPMGGHAEDLPNIVELAVSTPELSTLVTAVVRAGLDETLAGPGPFTVFAPTNDAFAAIDSDVLAGLLDDVPASAEIKFTFRDDFIFIF